MSRQFVESVSEAANSVYYVFIGKPAGWPNGWPNDELPPSPKETVFETQIDIYDNMIAGKRVTPQDVQLLVNRHDWQSGIVYDEYSHDDERLFSKKYYVNVVRGGFYDVFKCLSNNNGVPSIDAPDFTSTSPQDEIYRTIDGYQWKYMYSVDRTTFNKFSTQLVMPVVQNSNVSSNAISGTIDYIKVVSGGSNYNTYANGLIQVPLVNGDNRLFQIESNKSSNNDFYVGCAFYISSGPGAGQQRTVIDYIVSGNLRYIRLDRAFDVAPSVESRYEINPRVIVAGDGNGFIGRALVNATSNSIYQVEIVNRGVNYTYASANATLTVGVSANAAVFKPIISPQGGHGFDAAAELGCKSAVVSVTFNSEDVTNNMKLLDTNQYRVVGLLKDPKFANVELVINSPSDTFEDGETITQPDTGASGVITSVNALNNIINLTNVSGTFRTGNTTTNEIISSSGITAAVTSIVQPTIYFDQTYKLVIDNVNGTFGEDEFVYQPGANALFYHANNTVMRVTKKQGTFNVSDDVALIEERVVGSSTGAFAKVTGLFPGDLVPNSGQLLYIENMKPIQRVVGQTETLKLILEF